MDSGPRQPESGGRPRLNDSASDALASTTGSGSCPGAGGWERCAPACSSGVQHHAKPQTLSGRRASGCPPHLRVLWRRDVAHFLHAKRW